MRSVLLVLLLAGTAAADAKVTRTNVLDLELVQTGSSYVLRDGAFEVTFPGKPTVSSSSAKAPDGTDMTIGSALFDRGNIVFMFGVVPSARDKAYDGKTGIKGARDQSLARMNAKLVSDTPTKIDGRDARHVVGTVTIPAGTARIDEYLMWDGDHRIAVILMVIADGSIETADGKAFVASYKRSVGSHSPLDAPLPAEGIPVATGALDFELVREVGAYTLRDAVIEMRFPSRPVVTEVDIAPGKLVAAETGLDEVDSVHAGIFAMPPDASYDPKAAARTLLQSLLGEFKRPRSKQKAIKISGLAGTRTTFTGMQKGRAMQGEINIVWSAKQRMLVIVYAYTGSKKLTAAERAFLDSLVIHAEGKPPALPAAK